MARSGCAYPRLFEAEVVSQGRKKTIPLPLVFDFSRVGQHVEVEQRFTIDCTLLGQVGEQAELVFVAWEIAGQLGVGGKFSRFELVDIVELDAPDRQQLTMTCSDHQIRECHLQLVTPFCTRRRTGRKRIDVGPNEFEVGPYLMNILRRRKELEQWYGEYDPSVAQGDEAFNMTHLTELVYGLKVVSRSLQSLEYKRKSFRQDRYLTIRGVVGDIRIRGDRLSELLPLLWQGQWLHVGNNTSQGCGQYRLTI